MFLVKTCNQICLSVTDFRRWDAGRLCANERHGCARESTGGGNPGAAGGVGEDCRAAGHIGARGQCGSPENGTRCESEQGVCLAACDHECCGKYASGCGAGPGTRGGGFVSTDAVGFSIDHSSIDHISIDHSSIDPICIDHICTPCGLCLGAGVYLNAGIDFAGPGCPGGGADPSAGWGHTELHV